VHKKLQLLALAAMISLAGLARPGGLPAQEPGPIARHALPVDAGALARGEPIPALDSLVAGARVLMLGEPWHGDGGAIRLRGMLVKYLRRHHGFDAVVLEADFTSMWGGFQGVRSPAARRTAAADNVYPMWSRSAAGEELIGQIAGDPDGVPALEVYGMDPRIVGRWGRAHLPDSVAFWAAEAGLAAATDTLARVVREFLSHEVRSVPDTARRTRVLALVADVAAGLGRHRGPAAPSVQMVWSLHGAMRYGWQGASRDRVMGENLEWLLAHPLRGRRIVLWAHNNHILKDKWTWFAAGDSLVLAQTAGRSLSSVAAFTYLGAEAYRILGPRVVSIAVLSAAGRISEQIQTYVDPLEADFTRTIPLPDSEPGTVEREVSRLPGPLALLPLAPFRDGRVPLRARALDNSRLPALTLPYWLGFDAFLVLDRTEGLDEAAQRMD
jgi:hypothetical protein